MNYIIDGHNLIPHIPGLSLSMVDDEERLIGLLNRYGEYERGKPLSERAGKPLSERAGRPLSERAGKPLSGRAGKPLSLRAGRPLSGRAGKLEVYFDGAPAGQAGTYRYGRVQAHFVTSSSSADEAIRKRLARLDKSARGWVVITSDRSVRAAAQEVHATVIPSEEFARQLLSSSPAKMDEAETPDHSLSPAEVDEWLAIFNRRKSTK